MNNTTHILIVEDDVNDYDLAQYEIRKLLQGCTFKRVEKQDDFIEALQEFRPHIILSDYKLPSFDGSKVLELARQQHAALVPVIIWTGAMGEEMAVECMKQGAFDYILKEHSRRLGQVVLQALKEREVLLERKRAQEKYRAIFENSPIGIFQSTPQGQFLSVNPTMARMYGYASPQEMISSITDIAHQIYTAPEDRHTFRNLLEMQYVVENFEWENFRKDGSVFWTSTSARAVYDEAGEISYYEGFLQDITHRKLAEARLRESEARYHSIFENAQDAIFVESLEGDLLEVNQRACEIFGYTRQEFLQKKVADIIPSQGQAVYSPTDNSLMGQTIEVINIRANGEHFPAELRGGWYDFGGRRLILIILRDITERKQAEEALRDSESKYRMLAENSLQGIAIYQGQKIVYANPAMCQINGYTVEELMHMPADQIVALTHPDDRGMAQERAGKRMTGEPLSPDFEGRILRKDGTTAWLQSFNNPIEFDGKPALLSTMIDITQRKQAERERQALLEIIQGLANTKDLQEFLAIVHHSVGKAISAENFFVVLHHEESELFEEIYSVDQYDPPAPPSRLERSITSYVFRTGEPLLLTQARFDELAAQGEVELVGTDSASWLGVPLKPSNGTIGVMAVQDYQNPNRYSERDKDFLASISSQVALAIERKQAEIELQQKNDDLGLLNIVNHAVVQGRDLDSVMELLSKELNRIFSTVGSTIYLLSPDKKSLSMQQYSFSPEIAQRVEKLLGFTIPKIEIPIKEGGHFHKAMISRRSAITTDPQEIQNWIAEFVDTKFLPSFTRAIVRKLVPQIYKLLNIKSTIIVPLIFEEEILGFLDVSSPSLFPANDLKRIENIAGQLTAVIQRQQASEKIRESEERFRLLFENSGEAVIITQPDGSISSANPEACRMFGRSEEEIRSLGRAGIIDPNDPRLPLAIEERARTGRFKGELSLLRRDGSTFPGDVSTTIFRDSSGHEKTSMIIRDITERIQTEAAEREQRVLAEALRDTSQILSSSLDYGEVLDHILNAVGSVVPHDAATIMLMDADVAHVVRSQGYQKRDPNMDVMNVRLPLAETTNLRQMLETKQPVVVYNTFSFPGWNRSVATSWQRSNVGAPISVRGEVIGFILLDSETPGFFTPVHAERLEAFANQAALAIHNSRLLQQAQDEIAERKRAEQALRESDAIYRQAIEVAGAVPYYESYYDNGRSIKYEFIGEGIRQITGYGPEEFNAKIWDSLVEEVNLVEELAGYSLDEGIQRVRSGENPVWKCEHRIRARDGKIHWVFEAAVELRDENGAARGSIGTYQDITTRKQAEAELRASEERFRQLATNIEEAFWMTDAQTGQELYISPAAATIWGHSVDEMLTAPGAFINSVLQDDKTRVLIALEKQRNGEKTEIEYRVQRSNGSIRWVWDRAFPIFDENGMVKMLAGIAADITERKQAEEGLRASEERYHSLFQHLVDGFALHEIITDDQGKPIDYRFLEINPAFEKLTGLRAETTIGRRVNEILPKVGNERFISIYGKVALTGKPIHFEEYSAPLGRYYEIHAYSPRHGQFAVTFQDITERKQAEEDLRKLSRAVDQSASTIVITDIQGKIEYVNPKFTEVTGYSFEEAIGQNPRILKTGHTPKDEYIRLWATITSGEEWRGELYNRKKNGDLFWEQATISPIQNEQGEITHFVAVKEDITQRKQSEAEIQRHLVELQAVYENGLAVGQLLESRQIGERLIETFARHLSWHHVTIRLLRPETDELELVAFNLPDLDHTDRIEVEERFKRLIHKVGQGLSGYVVQTGTSLRTGKVHSHPQYISTQAGIESGLYMPLKIGNRVIGVISVESEAPDAFTEQDERLLATLATQAAIALENARLYQAAQQEILERERAQVALGESEAHYRELADSITEIMFELDPNLRYTHWNKASEVFSGLAAEDVIGRSMQDVFGTTEDQFSRERIYRRVLIERQAQTFETVVFPQGQRRILEINAYPSARGVSVVARDITERRLSEALQQRRIALMEFSAHHDLEELMQRAIDEVSSLTDSHIGFLHFVEADQKVIHMQAWSSETVRTVGMIEEKGMHYPVESAGVWADAVRQKRPIIHNEYESLPEKKGLPEGHARVIRELVVPIIRDDRVAGVLGIGNRPRPYDEHDVEVTERFADYAWDIIERKQMESALSDERNQLAKRVEERTADLSRANSNLARALRVKDEFLANMSHELRTPLNAILGLSESLSEQVAGPLNEKQQKYLNTINESGHHLLSLINDILDLAKIEAGQISLDINKVDVNSVCQASLRMIKQLAQKKNQEVLFEIDHGLGLMWADERRLKQMIVNLLSNAVKFTPEHSKLGLEVHGDQAGNRVLITVWDKGIGISSQDLDRLFRPFVQLDSGLAREATGTGLGLALVAQMARLHGGSVTVESHVGEGSRFTIQLPWEPALAAEVSNRLRTSGKFRAIDVHSKNKPTILLIEDTREVVMMLADYLEMAGFIMATAQDGIEGLEQARLKHPDLILMDIQMPRMDGFETTQKLRMISEFKDTPIIALTALAMPNDRQRCLDAGMSEYISKPVNLKMLLKLIRGILYEKEGDST